MNITSTVVSSRWLKPLNLRKRTGSDGIQETDINLLSFPTSSRLNYNPESLRQQGRSLTFCSNYSPKRPGPRENEGSSHFQPHLHLLSPKSRLVRGHITKHINPRVIHHHITQARNTRHRLPKPHPHLLRRRLLPQGDSHSYPRRSATRFANSHSSLFNAQIHTYTNTLFFLFPSKVSSITHGLLSGPGFNGTIHSGLAFPQVYENGHVRKSELVIYGETEANETFFMHHWGVSADGRTAFNRAKLRAGPAYKELEDGFLVVRVLIDPSLEKFSWEGFRMVV